MSYSAINANWERQQRDAEAHLIQEEARIANDLQRQVPDMTRTEALKRAKEIMNGWA